MNAMLTEFTLANFKSYSTSRLHLGPLTVLIGANAAGKSNDSSSDLDSYPIFGNLHLAQYIISTLKTPSLLVEHRLYMAFRKQLHCQKDVYGAGS